MALKSLIMVLFDKMSAWIEGLTCIPRKSAVDLAQGKAFRG
ncbi:hypothetical protein [Microcoleus sp. PH2017_32_RDM_D_A]|nr:hypothetical protein [Microcoleus sp. PH2017_32_RDM_D_A]